MRTSQKRSEIIITIGIDLVQALTFVDLGTPSCNARPGHTCWHLADSQPPNSAAVGGAAAGAAGSEITETALRRDIESHCEAQVRHSWRALHQRISYTTLKHIDHALCTRYLMRQNSSRTFACGPSHLAHPYANAFAHVARREL
jgi:hypothetical protein